VGLPAVPLLAVPVAAWLGLGIGLLLGYRRSASPLVLRLGAAFVGLWALIATTVFVAFLSLGGWNALTDLLRSPLELFSPNHGIVWLWGAAGAFLLLAIAFLLNQAIGRGMLRGTEVRPLPWPPRLPVPAERTTLLSFASARPDAFSFTLLELGPAGRPRPRRHEHIVLSTGLLERLTVEETEAVIAHELAHLHDLDGRYLTFVRTFARMMRWDPVLAYLAAALTRREELRADLAAARMTRRPRALARAIFKAVTVPKAASSRGRSASALLGEGGRRGRAEALRRIERLLDLERLPEFREEPRA
jgi:Zn-dependent protease with chaperone function